MAKVVVPTDEKPMSWRHARQNALRVPGKAVPGPAEVGRWRTGMWDLGFTPGKCLFVMG